MPTQHKIGFVGQGWLGKHYADVFEMMGYEVIRYAKEPEYVENKDRISECDIVFICVPTPSTKDGIDDSIVREAVGLVGKGKSAVIKSTVLPGSTRSIQEQYPDVTVMFVPEFLREASVKYDTVKPDRNIVGIVNDRDRSKAEELMRILPNAPYENICSVEEAEMTKYGGNMFLFWKVIFMNMLYDMANHHEIDWQTLADNMMADPRIGKSHMQPVHQMKHLGNPGRGAGGHCFIKDFAAFEEHYRDVVGNKHGMAVLEALREKNLHLLTSTNKDLDLIEQIYGEQFTETKD